MCEIKWIEYWNLFSSNAMPFMYIRFVLVWASIRTHTVCYDVSCFYLWLLFFLRWIHKDLGKVIPKHYRVNSQCQSRSTSSTYYWINHFKGREKERKLYEFCLHDDTTALLSYSMGDVGMKMVSFNLFMNNDIKYLFFFWMYSSFYA